MVLLFLLWLLLLINDAFELVDNLTIVLVGLWLAAAGFVGFAYYAWLHDVLETSPNPLANWLGQKLGIRWSPETLQQPRSAEAVVPTTPAPPETTSADRPRIRAVAHRPYESADAGRRSASVTDDRAAKPIDIDILDRVGTAQAAAGGLCPFCQTDVRPPAPLIVCPSCGVPYHAECWHENGGCAVFGCESGPN